MAPESLVQSLSILLLVILFMSLSRNADAMMKCENVDVRELCMRCTGMGRGAVEELMFINNIIGRDMNVNLNKTLATFKNSTARLNGIEHRMEEMSASIQEINKKMEIVSVAKKSRDLGHKYVHDLSERVVTGQAAELDPTQIQIHEVLTNLAKRFDRLENGLTGVKNKIEELESRLNGTCINKHYLDQLHNQTNEICALSSMQPNSPSNLLEPLSNESQRPNRTVPGLSSSHQLPLSNTLLSNISAAVKSIDSRIQKVTKDVAEMQWDLSRGKLFDVDSSLSKIKDLISEMIEELDLKKAGEQAARLDKPKIGFLASIANSFFTPAIKMLPSKYGNPVSLGKEDDESNEDDD